MGWTPNRLPAIIIMTLDEILLRLAVAIGGASLVGIVILLAITTGKG